MKLSKKNIWRPAIQFSVLIYILILMGLSFFDEKEVDFEKYCPFGGLQAIGSWFNSGSLACTMSSTQITMGLMLMVAMVLFGKLFCSYICPLGTLGEWFHSIGKKLKITLKINPIIDGVLRSIKYILLFIVFYFTLSSSELFCKQFDPFYAITSGFGYDVVAWMAILSITLWLVGSLVFKMFFCKYLCPLGAITNLFRYFIVLLGILGMYWLLVSLEFHISYVWPLAIASSVGYILELRIKRNNIFPVFVKVQRNLESCIDCNLCSEACHQGIDVANLVKVNHPDCNLCNDCLYVCPEKNTLTLSGKPRKWLTPTLVVVFVGMGILIGTFFELPTITEVWGDSDAMKKASVFRMDGIRNINCYGSSMAFATQLKDEPGILGVATYVNAQGVKIWYNDSLTSEDKIKAGMFDATMYRMDKNSAIKDSVKVLEIGLDKYFDSYDETNLRTILEKQIKPLGFETEYACPVVLRLYFSQSRIISRQTIEKEIETKALRVTYGNEGEIIDPGFKVVYVKDDKQLISYPSFVKRFFNKQSFFYNNRPTEGAHLMCYSTKVNLADEDDDMPIKYMSSHLSRIESIYGFENDLDSIHLILKFYYDANQISENQMYETISTDSLSITYASGTRKNILNPFSFKRNGFSQKIDNLDLK